MNGIDNDMLQTNMRTLDEPYNYKNPRSKSSIQYGGDDQPVERNRYSSQKGSSHQSKIQSKSKLRIKNLLDKTSILMNNDDTAKKKILEIDW